MVTIDKFDWNTKNSTLAMHLLFSDMVIHGETPYNYEGSIGFNEIKNNLFIRLDNDMDVDMTIFINLDEMRIKYLITCLITGNEYIYDKYDDAINKKKHLQGVEDDKHLCYVCYEDVDEDEFNWCQSCRDKNEYKCDNCNDVKQYYQETSGKESVCRDCYYEIEGKYSSDIE